MVLFQLSVLLMLASTHSHPHKRQADDMDHGDMNCLSPCIFEKEDQPGSKYCFAAGDMKVECEDDMDFTPTGGPRPTEGPEGNGATDDNGEGPDGGVTGDGATTAEADDEVVTRVKGYIDAGTCGSISSSSSCG